MTADCRIDRVDDLKKLRLLLAQDEVGLREYVCPQLGMGDVWWIPDSGSGFGGARRHPWVVVRGYSVGRANVAACPRTTRMTDARGGLPTPPGILPGLDQEGLVLLKFRRQFAVEDFREFEYVGRLSEVWIKKIREFYRTSATDKHGK